MRNLDFENLWIFAGVTLTVWVVIFVAIELTISNGTVQSGIIQGVMGGLAYTVAYKAFQKYSS